MTEHAVPSSRIRAEIWTTLWRLASSPRVRAIMLVILAALALLSTMIPQIPEQIADDAAATARWLATHVPYEGTLGRIMGSLGLFHIYRNPVWRILCGLLFVSLAVYLADLLPGRWRLWTTGPSPEEATWVAEETFDSPIHETAQSLRARLPANAESPDEQTLVAQRGRIGIWAMPMASLGGILLLIGLWVSSQIAWHEPGLFLPPGRSIRLAHRPDVTLQLAESSPPQIQVTDSQGSVRITPRPGDPARWQGIGFYVTGQRPAVAVRATSRDGRELVLQPLEGDPGAELTLAFPQDQTESGFAVPDEGLVFRLVNFDHPPEDPDGGPAILVQAFQADQAEPIYNQFITADTTIEVGQARYTFHITSSPLLAASHDPGFPLAVASAALIWLGYLISLVSPYQGWHITLRPARESTRVIWRIVSLEGAPIPPTPPGSQRSHPNRRAAHIIKATSGICMIAAGWLAASFWWNQRMTGQYWTRGIGWVLPLALTLLALAWHSWMQSSMEETTQP
ncbi:MAG: cytochrome c biogenesis protein ResB [Chloroflexi bacterium]|nr:cytochrome c biogenesis protein ResB [Chloroflexota bacterium]